MTLPAACPTCRSTAPSVTAHSCYNPWHRGIAVHFQREPIGTPHAECHAACDAEVEDAPSELAIGWEFVSCPSCLATAPDCNRSHPAPSCADPACYREEHARKADAALPGLGDLVRSGKLDPAAPAGDKIEKGAGDLWRDRATIIRSHRELSDDEIDQASPEDLRAAYRSLCDHHVTETTALVARRNDLRAESARLSEIIDFMRNHYSPIGGRACALCVYEDGRFIRPCGMHRWEAER